MQGEDQARQLPTTADGDIDWDTVSDDYHSYILGPFAPKMVALNATGQVRNTLVADLAGNRLGLREGPRTADFGCGPGNLIPHLPAEIDALTGVDTSQRALSVAGLVAERHHIRFEAIRADLCALDLAGVFDVIFCVNAILPDSREKVVKILGSTRRRLRPAGRLVAILPSYDTTVYLRDLWHQYHVDRVGRSQADQIIQDYTERKQMDDVTCSYADASGVAQCYHTPTTIHREFAETGLVIEREEKIYYPWELVRQFGYGYFPDAAEEIWDWYIVASSPRH